MADNYTCIQHVDFYGCDSSENSDVAYFLEKQSETLTSITLTTPTEKPLIAISKCQNLTKLFLKIWGSKVIDMNALGRLSNLRCLSLECIVNHNLGQSIEAAKLKHLNEIEFKYMNGLHDNDVSRIAQFYGPQLQKWTIHCCAIKYPAMQNIIDHCTKLCYLKLSRLEGLTKADKNCITEQLSGKVDYMLLCSCAFACNCSKSHFNMSTK